MPGGKREGAGRKPGVPNKATAELKELARQYTGEALDALVAVIRTTDSDQARVAAIREVFDRGYGKPSQAITGEDGGPFKSVTRIENVIVDPKHPDS